MNTLLNAVLSTETGCWLCAVGCLLLLSGMCCSFFRVREREHDGTHLWIATSSHIIVIFVYYAMFVKCASMACGYASVCS